MNFDVKCSNRWEPLLNYPAYDKTTEIDNSSQVHWLWFQFIDLKFILQVLAKKFPKLEDKKYVALHKKYHQFTERYLNEQYFQNNNLSLWNESWNDIDTFASKASCNT